MTATPKVLDQLAKNSKMNIHHRPHSRKANVAGSFTLDNSSMRRKQIRCKCVMHMNMMDVQVHSLKGALSSSCTQIKHYCSDGSFANAVFIGQSLVQKEQVEVTHYRLSIYAQFKILGTLCTSSLKKNYGRNIMRKI